MSLEGGSPVGAASKVPEWVTSQTVGVVLMLLSVLTYPLLLPLVDLSGEWGSAALATGMWSVAYTCVCAGAVHVHARRQT